MTEPRPSGSPYVELHARSAFSFLEGSSVPEELISRAAELNFPALAMLDRDNVSGAARFHMAAKKAGLRALIGAEVTCTDGHRYPLLAESRTGYQNLCRLITRMKLRAKKGEGAATPEEFAEYAQGLVCLIPVRAASRLRTPEVSGHFGVDVENCMSRCGAGWQPAAGCQPATRDAAQTSKGRLTIGLSETARSEEHTSELQSPVHLVCR